MDRKPVGWADRETLETRILGPGWMFSFVGAAVAGGAGGIWPVGTQGADRLGVLAAFVYGVVAAGVLALIWVPPLAACCITTELETGVAALRVAHGIDRRALRHRSWATLTGTVSVAIAVAGVGGVVGALVTDLTTSAQWAFGVTGMPTVVDITRSAAALIVAMALCGAIAELAGERRGALMAIWGSQFVTLALLTILYFAPLLRPLQYALPWFGIWPLRESVMHTPLLASDVERDLGLSLSAGWAIAAMVVGSLVARRRSLIPRTAEDTR